MQNQNQTLTDKTIDKTIPLENILVVPTKLLFFEGVWQGLRGANQINLADYLDLIQSQCQFLSRPIMEYDFNYKQIIPYLVFKYQDKYFLMQRSSGASESRLRSKYSLGIGGHIIEEDMQGGSIFEWAKREFSEEVNYAGQMTVQMLGILNDDSNEVGKVHLGLVMLLTGDSDNIKVKSELKSGELLSINECLAFEDQMENWSKLVFAYLKKEQD
jgi:predicted NUDIX family phosphoesterase